MKSRMTMAAGVSLATALVVAGCGGYGGKSSSTPPAAGNAAPYSSSPPATKSATSVAVKTSPLGNILVDGQGRTLYLFLADKGTASTCFDACANVWPPFVAAGKPAAGAGASAALLGTTARKDGKAEVTYHGHPLYYYASDAKPGDTTGQGLNQFGAEWYVLSAAGAKIEKKGS